MSSKIVFKQRYNKADLLELDKLGTLKFEWYDKYPCCVYLDGKRISIATKSSVKAFEKEKSNKIMERINKRVSDFTMTQIDDGEWYYKGCFITKVSHPNLSHKYEVRKDDKIQSYIGGTNTLIDAKNLAKENEVKAPLNGSSAYLY